MTEEHTERIRAKPIRGYQRAQLVRDIAIGVHSLVEIAEKYGRHYQAVKEFAVRNKAEIQRVREEYGSEMSVLWVANKFNRVAQLQQYLEDIHERVHDEPVTIMTAEVYLKAVQVCQKIMRDVAEEIGDLPTRSQPVPDFGKATYEIPGVDLGEVVEDWKQPVEAPK